MMCFEDPDFMSVYRERDCPNLLLQWVFDNTRNCIFLSHNGRCYDNYFILRALEAQGHYPSEMQDGTHLTMVTIPGVQARFVDTLSFMARSLAELPHDLGIEQIIKKDFFRYTFNTPQNEGYVGKIPGKKLFWRRTNVRKEAKRI